MADNVIKVSVTSTKSQRVSVSSSQQATNITASPDTGRFWAQTAKNWAVSENIVDNTDYSSKYYANESMIHAQDSQIYAQEASNVYTNFIKNVGTSINEVIETKDSAIADINSTKTTILNDIEFVADGEKKEIEDLIDNGKEELKESIGDVKILTTLEIGDIGIAPLGIDETKGKRRYLNGQVIIQEQYVQFTNKVKSAVALYPTLACTESEWQATATMTVGGQVGKFVVDDDAGTIRLPKIIMPIQGLTNLANLGEIVEAGLPNIEGAFTPADGDASTFTNGGNPTGAFRSTAVSNAGEYYKLSARFSYRYTFDASLSNPIYSNSNTVQQEQIQYPYFIQVATGAETEDNIINEIELNNPFSLLDYKYSEYELNNLSWLRSNGQYNSKAIYPAVYDLLLKIYNGTETKAGVSVKLVSEEYTDYDFVLNTAEETFRLPLLNGDENIVDYNNGITFAMATNFTAPSNGVINTSTNAYGSNMSWYWTINGGEKHYIGENQSGMIPVTVLVSNGDVFYITGNSDDTNNLYFYPYKGNGSLYFYVGETVQNANLINAGRIEEKVVSLIPDNSELIASYGIPDYSAGISGTFTSQTITAPFSGLFVYIIQNVGSGGVRYISVNGCMVAYLYNTSSVLGTTRCFPVSKGDIISTSVSAPINESYNLYPFKGVN